MSLIKIILKLYVCKTELGNYNKQIKFRQLQLTKDGDWQAKCENTSSNAAIT